MLIIRIILFFMKVSKERKIILNIKFILLVKLVKSLDDLNFEKSITFFNLCKKYIENMTSVKEIILLDFFNHMKVTP